MTGTATHITGYLGGADQAAVSRFIEAAVRLQHFQYVLPIHRQPDHRIVAVAFIAGQDDQGEQRMDAVAKQLGGILPQDITVAVAWEPEPGRGRRHGWTVKGGGQAILGEVIREDTLLPGPGRVIEGAADGRDFPQGRHLPAALAVVVPVGRHRLVEAAAVQGRRRVVQRLGVPGGAAVRLPGGVLAAWAAADDAVPGGVGADERGRSRRLRPVRVPARGPHPAGSAPPRHDGRRVR